MTNGQGPALHQARDDVIYKGKEAPGVNVEKSRPGSRTKRDMGVFVLMAILCEAENLDSGGFNSWISEPHLLLCCRFLELSAVPRGITSHLIE